MSFTISPGHWTIGTGASSIIDEVAEARKVVNRVVEILRDYNIKVTKVQDDVSKNQSQNLSYLVTQHNLSSREFDFSVHFNSSGAKTEKALGTEVLFFSEEDKAVKLAKAIADATGLKNRGAKKRTDLAFLRNTKKPALLLEICFVNSVEDVRLYTKNFENMCFAIANCFASFINKSLTKQEQKEESSLEFSSKAMKEKYATRISSPGTKKLLLDTALSIPELGLNKDFWLEQYKNDKIKEGDYNALAYELAVYLAKKL